MGRQPCCDKVGLKKGPWTADEDRKLINFIFNNGQCCWRAVPKLAGLLRCGKSCRLRWTNYLRPDLKRGLLSEAEEKLVIDLHAKLGNRWSKIASHLQGRTDNEIKNHWNTHIKKKLKKMGIDPVTHKHLPPTDTDQNPQSLPQQQQDQSLQFPQHHDEENRVCDVADQTLGSLGFSTDEVPMIQENEILVPCPSSSSTSSISCSSGSPELSMEWPEPMELWGLDEFLGWDLGTASVMEPFNQHRTTLDQEAWKFEELF